MNHPHRNRNYLFKHFIITRFSINFGFMKTTKNNADKLFSPLRLNKRISYFKNFCIPSILNQTNKNFTWIIAIDKYMPKQYKLQMSEIIKNAIENRKYIGRERGGSGRGNKDRIKPPTVIIHEYFNMGVPDLYPSPDGTFPFIVTDYVSITVSETLLNLPNLPEYYTITLTVMDDDGGFTTITHTLDINL